MSVLNRGARKSWRYETTSRKRHLVDIYSCLLFNTWWWKQKPIVVHTLQILEEERNCQLLPLFRPPLKRLAFYWMLIKFSNTVLISGPYVSAITACNDRHSTPVHSIALHCTILNWTELYCTAMQCNVIDCNALNWTVLHWTALSCASLYFTKLIMARLIVLTTAMACHLGHQLVSNRTVKRENKPGFHCTIIIKVTLLSWGFFQARINLF